VLLADGDATTRSALSRALMVRGYRALSARDAMEADALLRAAGGPIHLLVTDIVLPDGSGLDLSLRLLRKFPALKTLFVSRDCNGVIFLDQTIASRTGFLAKPVSVPSFLSTVADMVAPESARPGQRQYGGVV
jgi:two-component system, cell cycle sensor histidine kinase and response regulator CckA